MRRYWVSCALSLVIVLVASLGAEEETEHRIRFEWAFGAKVESDKSGRVVSVERDTTLRSGDSLQFYIKPDAGTFVYLLYASAEGGLDVIYSPTGPPAASPYLPARDEWFKLDENLGSEAFYLIGTHRRLDEVERLLDAYRAADAEARPEVRDQVISKIRDLRRKHRRLSSRAERPISIAGNVRGASDDIARFVRVISGETFWARTFTIDHK